MLPGVYLDVAYRGTCSTSHWLLFRWDTRLEQVRTWAWTGWSFPLKESKTEQDSSPPS